MRQNVYFTNVATLTLVEKQALSKRVVLSWGKCCYYYPSFTEFLKRYGLSNKSYQLIKDL